MKDDIIHADDPRYEDVVTARHKALFEASERRRRKIEEDRERRLEWLIRSIHTTWASIDKCVHPRTRTERAIPVQDATGAALDVDTEVDRCTRCRMVVRGRAI